MWKFGALDGAMENLGPFVLWWCNGEIGSPFNKTMGKLWGAKWPDEENGKLGPLITQWNINLESFDDAMGKLETLAMVKLGPHDDLMRKLGAPDHYFFSNGLTLSNLWAGPNFNWEILDVMQAEKDYIWGP